MLRTSHVYVCHVCSLTSPPGPAFQSNQKCGSRQGRGGSLAAAPKNYRPTSTCLKIILATRLSARELSTWRLGRLSAWVFWTWRVGRPTALYFSVFLCSPVPRSEFLANGLDDGTFLQSSPSTGILTNGLDRAFWGGSAQKVSGLVS